MCVGRRLLRNEGQAVQSGHSVTFDPEGGLAMTPDGGVNGTDIPAVSNILRSKR